MDKAQATKLLASDNDHDRLVAARYFANSASHDDHALLQAALSQEKVVWVKSALRIAIQAIAAKPASQPAAGTTSADEKAPADELLAEAVHKTTRQFLHELQPILGVARFRAKREIQHYEQSKTRDALEHLGSFLQAMDTLSRASAAPAREEFDLAALITSTVGELDGRVDLAGGAMPVVGDKALIQIAFSQGLRNALEASKAGDQQTVIVSWGGTDRDFYIAVLDKGVGLPLGANRVWDIGSTTKEGHLGMGLALAKQAAVSLGAVITLKPRDGGGVSYEIRWPKEKAKDG